MHTLQLKLKVVSQGCAEVMSTRGAQAKAPTQIDEDGRTDEQTDRQTRDSVGQKLTVFSRL